MILKLREILLICKISPLGGAHDYFNENYEIFSVFIVQVINSNVQIRVCFITGLVSYSEGSAN